MHEHIEFFRAFVKNPLKVGAIAPSSVELGKMMLSGVCPSKNSVVLELGPGTGAFTKLINRSAPDCDSYLGIEIDATLVSHLQTKFPDLKFVNASACESFSIYNKLEFGKIEFIISGLPFASLPSELTHRILDSVDQFMQHGCLFRTFQYLHGYYLPPAAKFRERMKNLYGNFSKSPVILKNIPPAVTLTWDTRIR